jgi:acyl carrier protein
LDTREKVRNFIIENFMFGSENASLNDEDPFIDEGIIDSTGFLEVIGYIQDEFNFEVADKELIPDNFDSVNKLVAYIDRKVQATS